MYKFTKTIISTIPLSDVSLWQIGSLKNFPEVETKEPFNIAGLQSPFFIYSFYSSLKNEAGKGLNGMDLKKNKGKDKTKPNFWLWNPKRNSFCFGIVFFVFCWLPFFFFKSPSFPVWILWTLIFFLLFFSLSSLICSMVLLHIIVVENRQTEIIF